MHANTSFVSFIARVGLAAAAFAALTGARGCSAGLGVGGAYAGIEEPPVVVVDHPVVVVDAPVPALLGDVALTVTTPEDQALGVTQTFSVVVRHDSAYGPVATEGHDFVFDASGVGPVDLTDLPYGYYDVEIVGYDAWGGVSATGAVGVTVDEAVTYAQARLYTTATDPLWGSVALDLVAPDGGAYELPIDTVDYYLWHVDPVTGATEFVESLGYIAYASYDPVVIESVHFGTYYVEVDAFDATGYRTYTYAAQFLHDRGYTQVVDTFRYAN